jgi:hypothetical protein
MMSNRQSDLHTLGYTQQWLEYGILTEDQLQAQMTAFNTGEDTHTEHYRYQTLSRYITDQHPIGDKEVSNLLDLVTNDPNSTMASSAVILLLKKAYLTDEQFEMVAKTLSTYGEWTHKEVLRQRERRRKETLWS